MTVDRNLRAVPDIYKLMPVFKMSRQYLTLNKNSQQSPLPPKVRIPISNFKLSLD